VLLAACASSTTTTSGPGAAAVAPQLTVERFLSAVNARDLESMARLFGTAEGPVWNTGSSFGCFWKKLGSWFGLADGCVKKTDVEIRMDVIANVLRHEDYRIRGELDVAGREDPTTRLSVDLVIGGRTYRDIGFEVVRTGEGRWLVQNIELQKITSR